MEKLHLKRQSRRRTRGLSLVGGAVLALTLVGGLLLYPSVPPDNTQTVQVAGFFNLEKPVNQPAAVERPIPPLDQAVPQHTETALFALG